MLNPGYGAPEKMRGLHPTGLAMVVVHNLDELSAMDPETQGAIIAAGGGKEEENIIIRSCAKKISRC